LIALSASLAIEGPKGKQRQVAAADFFTAPKSDGEREYALAPNEVLAAIILPLRGWKNATYEVRHRHGLDWPYVTASVAYLERNGSIADARIVLGHVAATPWVASSASASLKNSALDQNAAERCGQAAVEGARPLSRNRYKVQLAKTAVKRALLAAQAA
jgi:xanthine dehydrogenase YagS FAD-binding subunit